MSLATITIRSTHHYLLDCRGGRLLIDAGWAGALPQLQHALRRCGVEPATVRYVMLTYHHPVAAQRRDDDHAGLTQEVKRAFGGRLLIHERQLPYLEGLRAFHQRKASYYEPIVVGPEDLVVTSQSSRSALAAIGVDGELVETPGHSPDSVSLALRSGLAFTGDLHRPSQVGTEQLPVVAESWRRLLGLGLRTAYPAHADPVPAAEVERQLREAANP